MAQLIVYKKDGSRSGAIEVADDAFGKTVKKAVMRDYVLMYLANQRQGSASTRGRSEVAGSNKKPWRQKGTGRARAGTRKSPIWRGGGTVFGPHPKDFSYAIPKRARREALRSALLSKLLDGQIMLIEEIAFEKPATRLLAGMLKALGITRSCLIVIEKLDHDAYLSARNIRDVELVPVADINAYQVLSHRVILVTRAAMSRLEEGGLE